MSTMTDIGWRHQEGNREPPPVRPADKRPGARAALAVISVRIMKTLPILASLIALGCSAALSAADDDGFKPMFNGKDLSGWVPVNLAPDTVSVRDGMIVISGEPTGYMRTESMHENFILECDWQHMKEGGNSGVFIWGDGIPAMGTGYTRGIEVQVLDNGYNKNKGANVHFTTHGDIFPIWGATMEPTGRVAGKRSFPSEERSRSSPEWNHYRIECNNGEIRLSVNGKEVTVGRGCVPRKGFIALESEGSEVHFKNLRFTELPSTGATPEQTAHPYTGFRQLFSGRDLSGWKTPDDVKPWWSANGSHFVSKAGKEGHAKDLWTEKEYGDFELVADWRLTQQPEKKRVPRILPDGNDAVGPDGKKEQEEVMDAGDSGIYLRGSTKAQPNIWVRPCGSGEIHGYRVNRALSPEQRKACLPKENADNAPGKWNRFHITMKGDRVTVELNGKVVIDEAQLPGIAPRGPIGLQHHGDSVEFANLFIKEL
jgi:hypothetical protein